MSLLFSTHHWLLSSWTLWAHFYPVFGSVHVIFVKCKYLWLSDKNYVCLTICSLQERPLPAHAYAHTHRSISYLSCVLQLHSWRFFKRGHLHLSLSLCLINYFFSKATAPPPLPRCPPGTHSLGVLSSGAQLFMWGEGGPRGGGLQREGHTVKGVRETS